MTSPVSRVAALLSGLLFVCAPVRAAETWDGAKLKPVAREETYEFTRKPTLKRIDRDRHEISFASRGRCDVAVAVEDAEGRIVRHLAYGVLGPNAPAPLAKDALDQMLVWDGKNDLGKYVKNPEACRVRVSLGLKPAFDKVMGWHPKNLASNRRVSAIAADANGVYVLTGGERPILRAFGHDGSYKRTLVPFRADQMEAFKRAGLENLVELPDETVTYYPGSGGGGGPRGNYFDAPFKGEAVPTISQRMACKAGRLALASMGGLVPKRVIRLRTDGSPDGDRFYGFWMEKPKGAALSGRVKGRRGPPVVFNHALAASPDGKWLYITGLRMGTITGPYANPEKEFLHAVWRVPWDNAEPLGESFLGDPKHPENDERRLDTPTCVATDATGRIYVADKGNDRIQVFEPDGAFHRTINVKAPAWIDIDQKRGAIYALTRLAGGRRGRHKKSWSFHLVKISPLPEAKVVIDRTFDYGEARNDPVLCVDAWAKVPTVWLTHRPGEIALYADRGDSFDLAGEFVKEVKRDGHLPFYFNASWCHYLSADPVRPHLYLFQRGFKPLYRFDIETGRYAHVEGYPSMGGSSDDFAVGPEGLAYIRTSGYLVRFNPETWTEVPFDYGEAVTGNWKWTCRGGLRFPWYPSAHHHMGLDVAPNGDVLVLGLYSRTHTDFRFSSEWFMESGTPLAHGKRAEWEFLPRFYPGRPFAGRGGGNILCVWDRNGQEKLFDAVMGIPGPTSGVRGDRAGNIYLGYAARKLEGGKPVFGRSLVKFGPGGGRFLWSKGAKIPLKDPPERPPDFLGTGTLGRAEIWARGQFHWAYGGLNTVTQLGSCICPNTRFDVDRYGRVFAPESHRSSVAVLDTNGNFVLRLGRYGNADSGRGPDSPIKVGAPEIALAYCTYLAADSGRRRLYLCDQGNGRIVGVRIEYEREVTLPVK